jgi:zinc protease
MKGELMPQMPTLLKTSLDNGLTVLIKEVRRAPVASFWIWYRVGGRNEVPGITGISHWVEHMLFKGTPTYRPGEIFRTVNKHGGTLNGFTWIDYTAYFETLPSANITLGADIESDRMKNAIFSPDEVQQERTVIISEREGNENQPTFFLREDVNATAYLAHPYRQGVIGFKSDLRQITRDDLYRHYQTYYCPNNAAVVVVGDVDGQAMLDEIARRFSDIECGPEIPPVRTVEPEQLGERRVMVRRPAPTASLLMAYHAPAASSPDAIAMTVLDTILSGGKTIGMGGGGGMGRSSRLYRALVATGLASSVGSSFALTIDPYLFSASATLIPGTDRNRVEEVVTREIDRLREEPVPEEELARAIKQLRAQFAYADESVTSQGYWIGSLQTVAPDRDPDGFVEEITRVTPDEVLRVANTYLSPSNRTVGWLVPTEADGGSAAPTVEPAAYRPHFFSDGPGSSGASSTVQLALQEHTLDNSLRLLGHYNPTGETAVVEVRIPAGAITDGDTPGLARFTGQTLARGTTVRSFAELNEELDSLGAAISVGVTREYVDVSGKSLKEDVRRLIELMAEVVLQPAFPQEEVGRVREQSLTLLRQALNDTRAQADYTLRSTLYPAGHPYHGRIVGTEETLKSISREDLIGFHQRAYQPGRAIVATVGDVPVDHVWALIEDAFGGWSAQGGAPSTAIPQVEPPGERLRRDVFIPGKSQADIALGLPALSRDNPDLTR